MPPKKKLSSSDSPRQTLRAASAYKTARIGSAIVLIIAAIVSIFLTVWMLLQAELGWAIVFIISTIWHLVTLGLVGAVFDIADASVAGDQRERGRDLRETRDRFLSNRDSV